MVEKTQIRRKTGNGQKELITCKLTDFGFACVLEPGSTVKMSLGTPLFMAPEVVKNEAYDQKVDIWSLGVIAYMVLTSCYPFDGICKNDIYQKIRSNRTKPDYTKLDRYWKGGSVVKDFIASCLQKDPDQRHSAEQLIAHPWFKAMVLEPKIPDSEMHETVIQIESFKRTSQFQSYVISFLVGLKASKEELAGLRQFYTKLDKNKNGYLEKDELIEGISLVKQKFPDKIDSDSDWDAIL